MSEPGTSPKPQIIRRKTAVKLAAKVLQAHTVAKEIKRLGERGVRFLPKGKMDKTDVLLVNDWIKKMNNSARVSENLLIAAIDQSEKGIASIKEFNQIKASIKMSAELGLDNKPGLWNRSTHYNPTVAGEILKLAFSMNKSFSFAVHLLLLYGLESLAEEISTTGPHPPTDIESPSKAIAQNQKQAHREDVQKERTSEFQRRNPTWSPDQRPSAHVIKLTEHDMEPKSRTDGYTK